MGGGWIRRGERTFFSNIPKFSDTSFFYRGHFSCVGTKTVAGSHHFPLPPPPFLSLMGGFLYQGVEWCVD